MDDGESNGNGRSSFVRGRWTCPLCGRSRSRIAVNEHPRRYLSAGLKLHLRTVTDELHGDRGEMPSLDQDVFNDGIEIDEN